MLDIFNKKNINGWLDDLTDAAVTIRDIQMIFEDEWEVFEGDGEMYVTSFEEAFGQASFNLDNAFWALQSAMSDIENFHKAVEKRRKRKK